MFSVTAVVERASQVLREKAPHPLWVRGEVSGWHQHRSGHCYFRLKDRQAEIDCMIRREHAQALPALPGDGMEVDTLGSIGIYVRQGRFQLDVQRIETTGGDGLWHLARERLLAELRAEGLLDDARKRPLPTFPQRIGLVTSPGSAALHDMWRTMRRRAWWIQVLVSGCGVEGSGAAPEVVRALGRFGPGRGQVPVDVVIVARGGGSRESLWAFNLEPVARAIAACPYPVVTAIGHETDYTVADFVADRRAATPTAGAEYCTPDGSELLARLDAYPRELGRRADRLVSRATQEHRLRAEALGGRIDRRRRGLQEQVATLERLVHSRAPRERHRRMVEQVGTLERGIHRTMGDALSERRSELADREAATHLALELRLRGLEHGLARRAAEAEAKSPLKALARGYAVVRGAGEGRVVRAPEDAPPGTPLLIHLSGGALRATSQGPAHDPAPAHDVQP